MSKIDTLNTRIDCILIWGHGMSHFQGILNDIRRNKDFKILKIQKYKPKNIKSFVKEMYSYDYAPFWHLKAKTQYLLKNSNEVCFIFINNFEAKEDYLDEGNFRHKESMTLKQFKEELRDKYNPYQNDKRTHDHVIHATDSEAQTEHILKYLGYKEGVNLFVSEYKFINIPYYIKGYGKFVFNQISVEDLYCNNVIGESWDKFKLKTVKVEDAPQFLALSQNMEIYQKYIDRYLGGALQEDYNLQRYREVYENFEYLKKPYESSYVLVEKIEDGYIILDGLHRACCHIKNGNKKIKVCQLIK